MKIEYCLNLNSDSPSVQLVPVHPVAQVHSNVPTMLLQTPPLAQCCWISHSFMSVNNLKFVVVSNGKRYGQISVSKLQNQWKSVLIF